MATYYTTQQGEALDQICHKTYGEESGSVEKVLAANPGLAAYGPILPFRTRILLPDIEQAETVSEQIRLWD